MGVYLPNMEMPTEGEYNMTLYVCSDGSAYMDVASFPVDKDKFDVIPVPPHGRCIDADALYRKMFVGPDGQIYPNNDVDNWPHTMAFREIKHHILFAPTIIDAEEGE